MFTLRVWAIFRKITNFPYSEHGSTPLGLWIVLLSFLSCLLFFLRKYTHISHSLTQVRKLTNMSKICFMISDFDWICNDELKAFTNLLFPAMATDLFDKIGAAQYNIHASIRGNRNEWYTRLKTWRDFGGIPNSRETRRVQLYSALEELRLSGEKNNKWNEK